MKTVIALNLDAPLGRDAGPNANAPGLICAANEARFTSTHYSTPLTGYLVGWRDPENLDAIIQRIFPEIPAARRFEFKSAVNAEQFLADTDDIREIGGSFKRVERQGTSVLGKTINKGLTVRVDHDEVDELDGAWQEMYVAWLTQRLLRSELKRGIAIVDAAATNAAVTWDANGKPDTDLRTMIRTGANTAGIRANLVLMSESAWDQRMDVYEPQNTPYANRAAGMDPVALATKLMVDRVEVVKARYQSSASAKTAIVPNAAYSYIAMPGAMKDDPTNVKRFTSKARGGQRFGVYVQEFEKFTDISVEHYSNVLAATTLGIRKITIT